MTPSNPINSQPLIYRIADALGVFHLVAPVDHNHTMSEVEGLVAALAGKSNTDHTHDHIILAGVGRMGVSEDTETKDGYVWVVLWDDTQEKEVTYIIKKDDLLKWLNPDSTPTANSTKFVTSGGVKEALDEKAPLTHTHNQSQILGLQKEVTLMSSDDKINISSDIIGAGIPRCLTYYIKNATGDSIDLRDYIVESSIQIQGQTTIEAGGIVVMKAYQAFARLCAVVETVF